jgi:glycerophosphoryl diester phosphodiesterase
MKSIIAALLLAICLARPNWCQEPKSAGDFYRITPPTPRALQELLRYSAEPLPLLSGHRGGSRPGFPENCLPTFEHTLRHTFAMLEVDPRYTKDGQIVLMHDATLERTTTGRGKVADHTLAELKQLRLKDSTGKPTEFSLPTLDEALEWARGKTVLVLDQKDVPVAARAKKIAEHKAESFAIMIVYSFKDAQECFAANPNIVMEVMIPNRDKLAEFDALEIPWRNVVAFVGHNPPEDRGLYESLHLKGVRAMIGTSRNLDRKVLSGDVKNIADLRADYRVFLDRGADLIETDIPAELGPMLYADLPIAANRAGVLQKPTGK